MGGAVYRLVRLTAVLLLLVLLPGFLPAAAQAQHLVRSQSNSPAEEGPPGKAEEPTVDAEHATLSKRIRSSRHRSKSHHFVSQSSPALIPASLLQPSCSVTLGSSSFSEQTTPLRC